MTLTVKGFRKVAAELRRLAKDVPRQVEQALRIEAELIMTEAKEFYVPVDLGTLRSSGVVEPVQRRGDKITVELVFGSAAAPYALAVHEHPSQHSPPSWTGKAVEDISSVSDRVDWSLGERQRGPKYLERPLRFAADGMAERIARRVQL